MKTVNEFIRTRLYQRAGLVAEISQDTRKILADAQEKCDWLDQLVPMCKDRLRMGTFRYGVADHARYNYADRLQHKKDVYDSDGNLEFLLDVINYAVLEFFNPKHPDAHFAVVEEDVRSNRESDF